MITWPTVQEQINYWNTKERLEHERVMSLDKRDESRDATNKTRHEFCICEEHTDFKDNNCEDCLREWEYFTN